MKTNLQLKQKLFIKNSSYAAEYNKNISNKQNW